MLLSFWVKILEKREADYMNECVKNMPKECRALYLNFLKLQKETKNLKNNLTSIKSKKQISGFIPPKKGQVC